MIVTPASATPVTPATVLAPATDWRTATTDLITWLVANDRCFSSGEVAAYLRTYRPDLAFSVPGVGEYIRNAYDNGGLPSYDDGQGGTLYPTQVPRTTTGIARTLDGRTVQTRTPVGQSVFVYAKDGVDGFAHDFEVYIPAYDDPQAQRAVLYTGLAPSAPVVVSTPSATPGAAPVVSAPPTPQVGVIITGALKKDDLVAYVTNDRRLTVPRAAFEAFVALTGIPLRGGPNGDPVYVTFDGRKVVITRDASPTSQVYHLWVTRGRIAIQNCPGGTTPGEKFTVTVTSQALTIDLSAKV